MRYKKRTVDAGAYPQPWAVMDRLSDRFGEDSIRPLIEQFAVMLEEAIALLDRGEGRVIAHRVAGVAGTLGFSGVSQCWLTFSETDDAGLEDLRIESARALAIIAERYGNALPTKTSV